MSKKLETRIEVERNPLYRRTDLTTEPQQPWVAMCRAVLGATPVLGRGSSELARRDGEAWLEGHLGGRPHGGGVWVVAIGDEPMHSYLSHPRGDWSAEESESWGYYFRREAEDAARGWPGARVERRSE